MVNVLLSEGSEGDGHSRLGGGVLSRGSMSFSGIVDDSFRTGALCSRLGGGYRPSGCGSRGLGSRTARVFRLLIGCGCSCGGLRRLGSETVGGLGVR